MGDRSRGRRYPRTVAAERAFAVLMCFAVAALAAAFTFARGNMLPALGPAVPFAVLALALEWTGHPRAWPAELAAPLALGAVPAAMALAQGWPVPAALGLWGALATRIVPTVPYIRARVRLDRGERTTLVWPLMLQLAGILWAAWLARQHVAPRLVIVAAVLLALRAAYGLSPWRPRSRVMVLGLTEVAFGLATVALIAMGVVRDW
jgi:hypothetical protein